MERPPDDPDPDPDIDPDPDTDIDFDCPRCHRPVTARFYGPCPRCAGALAEAYPGLAREVEVAEYEPKMNVVPNQIATRD